MIRCATGIICALLLVRSALAGPGGGDPATAEALFLEGRRLFKVGKTAQACQKFEASQRAEPALGTLLNLGACYEKLGMMATAWAHFREAKATAQQLGDQQREELARSRADALEPKLARIRIEVPSGAQIEGLVVRRGDTVLKRGAFGAALPVDPGEYEIEAEAPSHKRFQMRVTARAGQTTSVTVSLEPEPRVEEITSHADGKRGQWRRGAGLAIGAIGIVGFGVGSYFGLQARSTWKDARKLCSDDLSCTEEGVALGGQAGRSADRATLFVAIGGAVLATGLFLWWTAPSAAKDHHHAKLTIVPAVGRFTGIVIEGHL